MPPILETHDPTEKVHLTIRLPPESFGREEVEKRTRSP
jgi:hypothetical protein